MKTLNKMIFIFLVLVIICSITVASAANNNSEIITTDNNINEIIEIKNTDTNTILKEPDSGTFADLNSKINNSATNEIVLENDYTGSNAYNDGNGVVIEKDNVIIDGKGHTIDGSSTSRIFYITGDGVTLKNIRFINGYSDLGGAICAISNMNIVNCTFINNNAEDGGAIYLSTYASAIVNSTFINNNASCGGAVLLYGWDRMYVINSTFINNTAIDGAAYYSLDYSRVVTKEYISGSVFINNTASRYADVFVFLDSNATIRNSIFLNYSDFIFSTSNSTVNANYNWFGNTYDNRSKKPFDDYNTILTKWLYLDIIPKINSTSIISINNVYDDLTGETSTFTTSVLPAIDVNVKSDEIQLNASKVTLNHSGTGELKYDLDADANITVGYENVEYTKTLTYGSFAKLQNMINNADENSIIRLNRDYEYDTGDASMGIKWIRFYNKNNITIEGNGHVIDAKGMGFNFIITEHSSFITFKNLIIKNGVANGRGSSDFGAGLLSLGSNTRLVNCTFMNNTANGLVGGGAVAFQGHHGEIIDCTFIGNSHTYSVGGALYLRESTIVLNSRFINNSANSIEGGGGAIYIVNEPNEDPSTIEDCEFIGNSALIGGAIYSNTYGNLLTNVYNCTFIDNVAISLDDLGGGAIHAHEISIKESRFIGNAAKTGSAVDILGNRTVIDECTFINNTIYLNDLTGNSIVNFVSHGRISHSIFLNNNVSYYRIIQNIWGGLELVDNWFGNTGNDYKSTPNVSTLTVMNSWLYLNSTELVYDFETGKLNTQFNFLSYDVSTGSSSLYDYSLIHTVMDLKLSGEGVKFNRTNVHTHEEIVGNASYTGKIIVECENIRYTIPFKFQQKSWIEVNSTIHVLINGKTSIGDVVEPLGYDAMLFIKKSMTYTVNDTSIVKIVNRTIIGLKEGLALLTIKFNGRDPIDRDRFLPSNATVIVNVTRIPTVVKLIQEKDSMIIGDSGNFLVSLYDYKGGFVSGGYLNSESNDTDVLRVSANSFKALGEGVAKVTYTFQGNNKYLPSSLEFNVAVSKKPATFVFNPGNYIELNQSKYYFVGVNLKEDFYADLTFESNDTSVAIYENGAVYGLSKGVAKITVRYAGSSQRCANETYMIVNVTAVETHLEAPEIMHCNVTDFALIEATLKDQYGNTIIKNLQCTSNNESIARCEGQSVQGIAEGQAIITVTYRGGEEYLPCSVNLTVIVSTVQGKITVNQNVTAYVGDRFSLNATVNDPRGKLTYVSSDPKVVSVYTGGIRAVAVGKANITISYAGNEKFQPTNTTVEVTVKLVPSKIIVNKTFGVLIGDKLNLSAVLAPNQSGILTYLSSNESIVTVDNGIITAIDEGSAIITINYSGNNKYAPANATVLINVHTNIISTEIEVVNENIEVNLTESVSAGATLNPNNAGELTYSIADPEIISIENGIIKGLKEGQTTVTVRFEGYGNYSAASDKTINVVVKTVETEIKLDNNNIELYVDDSVNANATLNPQEAGKLTYISDNESVAKVDDNGNIVAVGEGTCHITIAYDAHGKYTSSTKTLTVKVSKIDTTISVYKQTVTLNLTDGEIIKATLTPASEYTLTYLTSNSSVATVDSQGRITTTGEGSATITISYAGNHKYNPSQKTVTVVVKTVQTVISVDSEDISLYVDDNVNVNATLSYPEAGNIVYTSTNESVATVDGKGNVVAKGRGSCDINIAFNGNGKYLPSGKTVKITVSKFTTEMHLDAEEFSLYVDDVANANATLNYPDAGKLIYASGNESVATVDEKGNIRAIGQGITTVTVKFSANNKFDACEKTIDVKVSRIPTKIEVASEITLVIGQYVRVNAVVTPNNSKNLIIENNSDIIEINEGMIGAITSGNTTIIIRYLGDDKYAPASETVKVVITPRFTFIDVNDNVTLAIGDEQNLNAALSSPNFVISGNLIYTSNNTNVVSVDNSGRITAHNKGHAQIIIKYEGVKVNGNYVNLPSQATVNVTVVGMHTRIELNTHHIELVVGNNRTVTANLIPNAGKLKFKSSNETVATVDENGRITALTRGNSIITVFFEGDDDHLPSSETISVTVSPIPTDIEVIRSVSIVLRDSYKLNPTLTPNPGPIIYLDANDGIAYVDENGEISTAAVGESIITVIFEGNETHAASTRFVTVHVTLNVTSISVNKTMHLNVGENNNLNATLTPRDAGNLLYTSNDTKVAIVDSNGRVVARSEGTAIITVRFAGNSQYHPSEENVTVTVTRNAEAIKFDDTNPDDSNDGTYSINLPADADGTFTILVDGKEYATERLVEGKASIKVTGLKPGDHEITMIYSGDRKYSAISQTKTVHIYQFELTKNSDQKAMYPNSVTYSVHLTKDTEIMPGKTVTFKINGKTYKVKTDKLGYAYLKVSLPPKTYTITAQYDDTKVTNKITFTHIIKAKNLKVKKSASKIKVKVTLNKLNKKILKGKKVTLKFKGKKYTAKTNKKGVATFTIKKNVIKKLKAGKKYKYTVIYSKDKLTKTIMVKK